MKTLSRIIIGLAFAAPLTITSAARADDQTPPDKTSTDKTPPDKTSTDKTSPANEKDVTMEQLPKAVRTTAQREAKSKTIQSITRTDKNGAVAYEIRYLEGNKQTTVDIATNGKVLLKRVRTVEATPGQPSGDMKNEPKPDETKPNEPNDNRPNDTSSPSKPDDTTSPSKPDDTNPSSKPSDTPKPPDR